MRNLAINFAIFTYVLFIECKIILFMKSAKLNI